MRNLRTAAQQALEALENAKNFWWTGKDESITALKAALEHPTPPPEAKTEAEKVAYAAGWWAALQKMREQSKFTLSCGCPSQYGGIPAQWPVTDREGNPAVAHGVICERHWHEYRAHCPDCEPNKDDWK
jgi:hypothetical protein